MAVQRALPLILDYGKCEMQETFHVIFQSTLNKTIVGYSVTLTKFEVFLLYAIKLTPL